MSSAHPNTKEPITTPRATSPTDRSTTSTSTSTAPTSTPPTSTIDEKPPPPTPSQPIFPPYKLAQLIQAGVLITPELVSSHHLTLKLLSIGIDVELAKWMAMRITEQLNEIADWYIDEHLLKGYTDGLGLQGCIDRFAVYYGGLMRSY